MVVRNDAAAAAQTAPGCARKVLARGGGLMTVEFSFAQGAVGAVHSHPHEQVGYIVKGRFELEMVGKKEILSVGDSYYVPPNMPHGVKALVDGVILDIFTPQREDFLAKQ